MADVAAASGDLIGGQITLDGTIQSIDTVRLGVVSLWVQRDIATGNVVDILDTTTGNVVYRLEFAGQSVSLPIEHTSALRVRGTAADTVTWGAVAR